MSHTASSPVGSFWVPSCWKEAAVCLLSWLLLLLLLLLLWRWCRAAVDVVVSSPMLVLPLLPVVYQECEDSCEHDDDQGFYDAVVGYVVVVEIFGQAGATVRVGRVDEVVVGGGGVGGVIVWVRVVEEGGEPLGEGEGFLRF